MQIENMTVEDLQFTLEKKKEEGRQETLTTFELAKKQFKTIKKIVCEYFDIDPEEISSSNRKREIVDARHIIMWFAHYFFAPRVSLAFIGEHVCNRDHATVIFAVEKVNDLILTDPDFARNIESMKTTLVSVIKTGPDSPIKLKKEFDLNKFPISGCIIIPTIEEDGIVQKKICWDGAAKKLTILRDGIQASELFGEAALSQFKQIACSINL